MLKNETFQKKDFDQLYPKSEIEIIKEYYGLSFYEAFQIYMQIQIIGSIEELDSELHDLKLFLERNSINV